MNTCVRSDHVAHLIVFEANYCVGNLVETSQSLAREMRDIRRRARSRASPQPSADEDHSRPSQRLANLLCRFKSGLIANLGVATCPQATGDCPPELYFVCSNGTRQRLHVGVERQNFCALQTVEHNPVERIQTGAADTDNFDWNRFLRTLRETVVFAKLNHIDLSISLSSSAKNSSQDSPDSSRRPICLHGLSIFD